MRKLLYILFALLLGPGLSGTLAAPPRLRRAARVSPLSDSLRQVTKKPDSAARGAFRKFVSRTGSVSWQVRYNPRTALPEALVGGKTPVYPGGPEAAAMAFLEDNRDLLKVEPSQLKLALSKTFMGVTHLQYSQVYNSLPVEFAYVRVHVNTAGEVSGFQSKFEPDIAISLQPAIPREQAAAAAAADAGFTARPAGPALVIYPDPDGVLKLAWKLKVRGAQLSSGVWIYYVDAANGKVLFKYDDLRYVCPDNSKAHGTVSGTVYDISPLYSGSSDLHTAYWNKPALRPISGQYVWTQSYADVGKVITSGAGEYCGTLTGKVFASLKGPYFAVTNFRGESAHFDNGDGIWYSSSTPVQSPHPYANSQTYPAQTVTLPGSLISAGNTLAKVMPHFTASALSPFKVGDMDIWGTITDWDELIVKNGAGKTIGVYTGARTKPFYGAAIEGPEYSLNLKTDEAGVHNGFSVDSSRYLVLRNNPTVNGDGANAVPIVWSTTTVNTAGLFVMDASLGAENALDEVNVFYHLNKMRDYFGTLNKDPNNGGAAAVDLTKQVPVMVHAHGNADNVCPPGSTAGGDCDGGMLNAFYSSESDNIIFGDGPMDLFGNYRSFALDGTIVRHEYVHLVMGRIYPTINFGEFGAVSEALADYFSLASFRPDGAGTIGINNLPNVIANFVGAGEGAARDLSGAAGIKIMPNNWTGEVHDDSLILSQALWQLKNSSATPAASTDLGNFSASSFFPNMARADVITFVAQFYFPDNFANFYDAMIAACRNLPGTGCNAEMENKITLAFSSHSIAGIQGGGDAFEGNNGPESATDISTMSWLSATISPAGDLDYYSLPLAAGNFTARLDMPASNAYLHHAYSLYLFDSLRNHVTDYAPVIYGGGGCPDTGSCFTEAPDVTLSYNITGAGRYYLAVAGALNQYGGNSQSSSNTPYRLSLAYTPKGSAIAFIAAAVYDNDTLNFSVPYLKSDMVLHPSSPTVNIPPGAETAFAYAQLRDSNYVPIAQARTDQAGYLELMVGSLRYDGTDALQRNLLTGTVRLKPGFASAYPLVGTVYLEIFGRNHLGKVVSLGVSSAINLTTNKSAATAYNNVITAAYPRAKIKYDVQSAGTLSIKIYTVAGTLVQTVFNGAVPAGKGDVDWDGTNSTGSKVASGIYFVKVSGAGLNATEKIAVVR